MTNTKNVPAVLIGQNVLMLNSSVLSKILYTKAKHSSKQPCLTCKHAKTTTIYFKRKTTYIFWVGYMHKNWVPKFAYGL
jgi:hypothetical protein